MPLSGCPPPQQKPKKKTKRVFLGMDKQDVWRGGKTSDRDGKGTRAVAARATHEKRDQKKCN